MARRSILTSSKIGGKHWARMEVEEVAHGCFKLWLGQPKSNSSVGRGSTWIINQTAWKVSKYKVISGPYFPVFGLNTEISNAEKYGAEITPYLNTFHALSLVQTPLRSVSFVHKTQKHIYLFIFLFFHPFFHLFNLFINFFHFISSRTYNASSIDI